MLSEKLSATLDPAGYGVNFLLEVALLAAREVPVVSNEANFVSVFCNDTERIEHVESVVHSPLHVLEIHDLQSSVDRRDVYKCRTIFFFLHSSRMRFATYGVLAWARDVPPCR